MIFSGGYADPPLRGNCVLEKISEMQQFEFCKIFLKSKPLFFKKFYKNHFYNLHHKKNRPKQAVFFMGSKN